MIEASLLVHGPDKPNITKAAAEEFFKKSLSNQEAHQQPASEQLLSPTEAGDLIKTCAQAKADYFAFSKVDYSTIEQQQQSNEISLKFKDSQNLLEKQYKLFPDPHLREQALLLLNPGLKDYVQQLSRIQDYGICYRFFIQRLEVNLSGYRKNINNIYNQENIIDKTKLCEKIKKAIEAINFVKDEKQSMGLHALVTNKLVDIFNQPDSIKNWKPFINSISSETQGMLFIRDIIGGSEDFEKTPPQNTETLKEWVQATSWVDTEEKKTLVEAIKAFRSIKKLNLWKNTIEMFCEKQPVVVVETGGQKQIKEEIPQKQFEEIKRFLNNNSDIDLNLTPEKALEKWNKIKKDPNFSDQPTSNKY